MRRRGQRGGREEADREVQRRLSGEEKAAAETIWRICGGGGGGGGGGRLHYLQLEQKQGRGVKSAEVKERADKRWFCFPHR